MIVLFFSKMCNAYYVDNFIDMFDRKLHQIFAIIIYLLNQSIRKVIPCLVKLLIRMHLTLWEFIPRRYELAFQIVSIHENFIFDF